MSDVSLVFVVQGRCTEQLLNTTDYTDLNVTHMDLKTTITNNNDKKHKHHSLDDCTARINYTGSG